MACLGSSRHAAGCPWRQTQAKDGVGCQPDTWSVEVFAILARMLDCTAGMEPGDPYTAPIPERAFLEAVAAAQDRSDARDNRGAELHPECLLAVQHAAKLCASLGPRGRRGRPQFGYGSIAAHERQDLGTKHRPVLPPALEGAGTRA